MLSKRNKKYDFKIFLLPLPWQPHRNCRNWSIFHAKFSQWLFNVFLCNTSYESLCNCLKPNGELFSISTLEFAQMSKISFSMKNYESLDILNLIIFFHDLKKKKSHCVRFQCLSSPVHMPIFMEILRTVIKKNLREVGKTWFLIIPCIGQRKYSVSATAGVHPVSQFHDICERKIEHNFFIFKLQCST